MPANIDPFEHPILATSAFFSILTLIFINMRPNDPVIVIAEKTGMIAFVGLFGAGIAYLFLWITKRRF
jgi:hypothetical protein